MHFINERYINAIDCQVNMFKNKIDVLFLKIWVCLDAGYERITGNSISHWVPCPVSSWVPNIIGTWGGNSVKFS